MTLELFRRLFRLPPAASSFADPVDQLHLFVVGTTLLGVAAIGLLTAHFVLRYRRPNASVSTPRVVASGRREALLISGTLALFLLWWVLGYRIYLAMRSPPRDALRVYVTAKQWTWKFSYEDGRSSNDVLTVPLGRPVELVMTSRDVIHSLFVPALRVKQDVLPGRYVSVWFEAVRAGSYPIFCAEYCGLSHSSMLGELRVLDPSAYRAWRMGAAPGKELAELGHTAALRHGCFSCHTVDGQANVGPTLYRLYGSSVLLEGGERVNADSAYLVQSMLDPAARVVHGYRALMPTYRGSLDTVEMAAIVEFIRSLALAAKATTVAATPELEPHATGSDPSR